MINVKVIEGGGAVIPESDKQFQEFIANDDFIHFVGMMLPPSPSVNECITLLEHRHYQPDTPRNELFFMRIIEWVESIWVIVSIPIEERDNMENIASERGLRIADGVPTVISSDGIQRFPADNKQMFTLENKSKYSN